MEINEPQKIAAKAYQGGEHAHVVDGTLYDMNKELPGLGDTLFRFVMVELGDKEGCDSIFEARRRILQAISDLDDIRMALEHAL